MRLAKVQDNQIVEIKAIDEMFPNTSFSEQGPDPEFLSSQNVYIVDDAVGFNPATQKIINVEPYIDGSLVRTVSVAGLTVEEIENKRIERVSFRIQQFLIEAQKRLDDFAKTKGYDSIMSVCTYKDSTREVFRNDAAKAIVIRDGWWETLATIASEVLSGQRAEPENFEALLSELPQLSWA